MRGVPTGLPPAHLRTVGAVKRMSSRIGIVVAVGLALTAGRSTAHALTVNTPSLAYSPGGYLECTVKATSTAPIGIVAKIVMRDGTNVTEFGTGFRSSPSVTSDGLYYAEETAGSFSEDASYCKASLTGARRSDVNVTLEAFDKDGKLTERSASRSNGSP
jgi:hypothetical protein